ncbi:MAG: L-erythro-3,5-diaminohexanoate dehydrogenase [Thermodesulfobacteriota bacterium]|nr:L-erythro-3,5-diaminohexanoate dehydrogenase [Thermodesulfobacteriota bacterium]
MHKKGDKYGTHRVLEPKDVLPQMALKLDNDFSEIYDNEILFDVSTLNIDAASFTDIKERAGNDPQKIARIMMKIVEEHGKHQNPRTGSGGVFIGSVSRIGSKLNGKIDLQEKERIVSLVSLSLTPLRIDEILNVHTERDQVDIKGQAVLFESSVWTKLPNDIPESLALAVLDVAGAPAQVNRLVNSGDTVAVVGAGGKSGILCCHQAKERAGTKGRVIAVIHSEKRREDVDNAPFVDDVIVGEADKPVDLFRKVEGITSGSLCDVVISCVSRSNCEMGSILITKERGKVYFFSMATNFTRAALGAEGVGKDVEMIIGNGYCHGHADLTLDILRKSPYINTLYTERYC